MNVDKIGRNIYPKWHRDLDSFLTWIHTNRTQISRRCFRHFEDFWNSLKSGIWARYFGRWDLWWFLVKWEDEIGLNLYPKWHRDLDTFLTWIHTNRPQIFRQYFRHAEDFWNSLKTWNLSSIFRYLISMRIPGKVGCWNRESRDEIGLNIYPKWHRDLNTFLTWIHTNRPQILRQYFRHERTFGTLWKVEFELDISVSEIDDDFW